MNTASRMESNSEKNKANMSVAAATALRKMAPMVRVSSRGMVEVKGKGKMEASPPAHVAS